MKYLFSLLASIILFTSCDDGIEVTPKSHEVAAVESMLLGTWNTDVLVIGTGGIHNIATCTDEMVCGFLAMNAATGEEMASISITRSKDKLKASKTYFCRTQVAEFYWSVEVNTTAKDSIGYENGYSFLINEKDADGGLVRTYEVMAFNPIVGDERINWLSVKLIYDNVEKFNPTNPKYYHIQFKKRI